jgi:hypothetical protein
LNPPPWPRSWPQWLAAFALALAILVRVPSYDLVSWAFDTEGYLASGRRILAGDWNVTGTLSAGLQLLSPAYFYIVALLLWVRDDVTTLAFFGSALGAVGTWFMYDAGRRLHSPVAGAVAALVYATVPALVIESRAVSNPGLMVSCLPVGYWLAARYREMPTLARALLVGAWALLLTQLHATGAFSAIAVLAVAFAGVWQRPGALVTGVATCLVPWAWISYSHASGAASLAARFKPNTAFWTDLGRVAWFVVSFPTRLSTDDPTVWATLATGASTAAATMAIVAACAMMVARRPLSPWLVASLSLPVFGLVVSSAIYSGPLVFYYFCGVWPPLVLLLGAGLAGLPQARGRQIAAAAICVAAMINGAFVYRFDAMARDHDVVLFRPQDLFLPRTPGGDNERISMPTVRSIVATSRAVSPHVADWASAMRAVRGARGELWREARGESLRPAGAGGGFAFYVGDPAATSEDETEVGAAGLCEVFPAVENPWRVSLGRPPAGWTDRAFDESGWRSLPLPARSESDGRGPLPVPTTWNVSRVLFRGRYRADSARPRHVLAFVVRTDRGFPHELATLHVNGTPVTPSRHVIWSSEVSDNVEWHADITALVQSGDNLVAVAVEGRAGRFDFDAFALPCLEP